MRCPCGVSTVLYNKTMNIYIVFHSQQGTTYALAKAIAKGAKERAGAHVFLRKIPDYPLEKNITAERLADYKKGTPEEAQRIDEYNNLQPYSLDELRNADALIIGSPVYYGNMSSATKIFIESLTPLWEEGILENKPAGVFVASETQHGGKEQTMISVLSSLMTFSMVIVGLPFRAIYMQKHGSIFGPTVTGSFVTPESESLASLFGKRIADVAFSLEFGKDTLKPTYPL